jgi:hypothetical protein
MLMRRILPALCVVTSACVDAESQDQLKDLRILAIQAEPPEVRFSYVHSIPAAQRGAFPLPSHTFRARALVVDPKGRTTEVSVRFCPDDPRENGCPGYVLPSDAPADQLRGMLPLVSPRKGQSAPELMLGGEVEVSPAGYTFGVPAMDFMTPATPLAVVNPQLPTLVVRAHTLTDPQEEVALHRVPFTLDLWPTPTTPPVEATIDARLNALVGFGRCNAAQEALARETWPLLQADPESNAEMPRCLRKRTANRNPRVARVLIHEGGGGGGGGGGRGGGGGPFGGNDDEEPEWKRILKDPTQDGFVDYVGPIRVRPRQTMGIRVVVPLEDHEHYQVLGQDPLTGRVTLNDLDEDMAFAWFATAGTMQGDTSERNGQDGRWNVGPDTPDGPAFVWVVVRDQRGGVTWRRLEFDVKEDPTSAGGRAGF